jgi:competence protein ComGF
LIRINLLPPEERASIKAVNTLTILLVIGIIIGAAMAFTGVYLHMQLRSAREQMAGYQETMASIAQFRSSIAQLEKDIKTWKNQLAPLERQLSQIESPIDLYSLLERVANSAQQGQVWLRDLTLQRSGAVPISGYAVSLTELDRFLTTAGRDPYRVQMGSQSWDVYGGVRLVYFLAQLGLPAGGDGK